MRHAATPVEAVTTRLSGGNEEMIFLSKKLFPLPAAPVKKTLRPPRHAAKRIKSLEKFTLDVASQVAMESFIFQADFVYQTKINF